MTLAAQTREMRLGKHKNIAKLYFLEVPIYRSAKSKTPLLAGLDRHDRKSIISLEVTNSWQTLRASLIRGKKQNKGPKKRREASKPSVRCFSQVGLPFLCFTKREGRGLGRKTRSRET